MANNSPSEFSYTDQFWHSLFYFNVYRIAVVICLIAIWKFQLSNFGGHNYSLFLQAAWGHVILSSISILMIRLRNPNFASQLTLQIAIDIIFICIMIYASGGLQSGLGTLLLVSLAGAGLISRGRMALFFASLATIGVLLQETYTFLSIQGYSAQYTHAGLLSMGYFAVAWLAHQLASYTLASEQLALERGADLANMAQINQLVIQDLQEGVLVIDKHGYIKQRNSYAEILLGLPPQSDSKQPERLSRLAPTLATRLTIWHDDASTIFDLLKLPNCDTFVRTRFVSLKNSSWAGVVIFLEDMSRVQSQVQQLKLAALGRLTANIAHEIRNPLSSINHAAELLAEEEQTSPVNPTRPRLIRIISENSQRLNKIVQDILHLNRRDVAQPEPIDLEVFFLDFLEDFCHSESIDRDKLKLDLPHSCTITFDRSHLNQILWNLCCNAWRHSQQQENSIHIKLTQSEHKTKSYLDVIDDGPGVPPQQLKQLFEPFFTTAVSGTGLGLYVAREMCEANHASLECIKNTVGGHFRITCENSVTHA